MLNFPPILTVNPIAPAAHASRAPFVPIGCGILPAQHRTSAGADVPDQRLQSPGLRFGRIPDVVRLLGDDVEIVHDVRRGRNIKRNDVVQGLRVTNVSRRVARFAIQRVLLIVERGHSGLMGGTSCCGRSGSRLLLLDALQLAPKLGVLLLELPEQTALRLHLGNHRLRHALVDGGQEVVQ